MLSLSRCYALFAADVLSLRRDALLQCRRYVHGDAVAAAARALAAIFAAFCSDARRHFQMRFLRDIYL